MASRETSSGGWQRPEDAGPFPREWDRFQGLKPMSDGRVAHFWIRDLPPALEGEAVEFMFEHYIREEVMAAATRSADDPQAKAEWEAVWRDAVRRQRVSLAAFTDWPGGTERLVAINLMGVEQADNSPFTEKFQSTRPGFRLYHEMLSAADVFRRYGARSYLVGLGLSVHPDFRGQGVALRLLRAREPLCAALCIPLSVTAFSGAQSQKQAQRAGFQVLQSRRYADFTIENGERPFKDATWTHCELSVKTYEPRNDQQQ